MMNKQIFKVKDCLLNIKAAYLDAFVEDDVLSFGLTIKAITDENSPYYQEFEDDEFCLYAESLFSVKAGQIQHWHDIAGTQLTWEEVDDDQPVFFEVFESEPIQQAKLKFEKHGEAMWVNISGRCDMHYDDDFSQDLAFEIGCEVDFYGVLCGIISEQEAWQKVTPFLNAEHLKYAKNPYDVSLLVPKDTNMQTNKLVLGDF